MTDSITRCAAVGCTREGTEPWLTSMLTPAGISEQLLMCPEHAEVLAQGRHVSFDRDKH